MPSETNIPTSIEEALTNEVYVETALGLLKEARTEQAASLETAWATRSPFNLLGSLKGRKTASQETARELEEMLNKSGKAIAETEAIRSKLDAEVRRLLESHLRKTDPDYSRGLDSSSHVTTWLVALNRYKTMLNSYITDLGQARNTVVAGYDKDKKKVSSVASGMLAKAVETATSLEHETGVINRLAGEYKQRTSNTPVESTELPEIPRNPYCEWTKKLQQMEIGPMLSECDRIIHVCESIADDGSSQLRSKAERMAADSKKLSEQYLLEKVDVMRRQARMRGIDHDKLEERVSKIEKRFSQTGTEWTVGF